MGLFRNLIFWNDLLPELYHKEIFFASAFCEKRAKFGDIFAAVSARMEIMP